MEYQWIYLVWRRNAVRINKTFSHISLWAAKPPISTSAINWVKWYEMVLFTRWSDRGSLQSFLTLSWSGWVLFCRTNLGLCSHFLSSLPLSKLHQPLHSYSQYLLLSLQHIRKFFNILAEITFETSDNFSWYVFRFLNMYFPSHCFACTQ